MFEPGKLYTVNISNKKKRGWSLDLLFKRKTTKESSLIIRFPVSDRELNLEERFNEDCVPILYLEDELYGGKWYCKFLMQDNIVYLKKNKFLIENQMLLPLC